MKKFLPFSKLLSRRILVVTFFTTIIVALCVIAFVTKGVIRMTDAYFLGQVKACNESVSKLLSHADQDSFYQYMRRIDGEINKTIFNEDAIGEDYQNMRAYCLVIDSVGNFIYHPDRQRIGQSWRQVLGSGEAQAPVPMTTDYVGQDTITLDGKSYYAYFARRANSSWSTAIVVPSKTLILSTNFAGLIILTIIVLGLLVTYWISRITIRRATKPLQLLAKSADEVAKGNFQNHLPEVAQNNEIGQLRDSFANMQQSLTQYIEQLKATTAQQAAIESELTIARDIQLSLVPTVFPERNDIDLYASMTPAKAVGGDLYDFFFTSDKLYFCIGDVSGKGVPAALFMTQAMSLFRAYSKDEDMPNRIVSRMNRDLSENNETCMFVTFFVGILDLTSGLLRYCNAGHLPPIILRSKGEKESRNKGDEGAQLLPINPCYPVGLYADTAYLPQEVFIEPQSTILFYTDGLNEAMDADNNEFGDDRILDEVNGAIEAGQLVPKDLIDRMTQAVYAFVGDAEQSDDLTMLSIQFK